MTQADLPEGFELIRRGGAAAAVRSDRKEQLLRLGLLDRAELDRRLAEGRPMGGGRGGAVALQMGPGAEDRIVVRRCRRGGAAGRLLGARYFTGSRPMEELRLALAALKAGVPTAEPLAAVVRRSGPFYRGVMVFRELEGCVSLEDRLRTGEGPGAATTRTVSNAVADTFARMVAAGVYHPDLHAGNVLLGPDGAGGVRAYVIDFDRAKLVAQVSSRLRDRMLFRFNRGLVKRGLAPEPASLLERVRFCRRLGIGAGPAEMRRFVRRCARHLRWHAWRYGKHTGE